MDSEGNLIKRLNSHTATVNEIVIDETDEFVGSASDDGIRISPWT